MKKAFFRLFVAVLLGGILLCGAVMLGLGYANNLSPMERAWHPEKQTGTVWISEEGDLYLVNRDGTLRAYVFLQDEWQKAEFSAVGARYHVLLLKDQKIAGGSVSMSAPDRLRWRCDPEDVFAEGRRRILLQRDDYEHWKEMFPFSE